MHVIDVAVPADRNIKQKEAEKPKYKSSHIEKQRKWNMRFHGSRWRSTKEKSPVTRHDNNNNNNANDEDTCDNQCKYSLVSNS